MVGCGDIAVAAFLLVASIMQFPKAVAEFGKGGVASSIAFAEEQYTKVASYHIPILERATLKDNPAAYPFRGVPTSAQWRSSKRQAWTSGFLSGIFWKLSRLSPSNASTWIRNAEIAQRGLIPMEHWNSSHDVGFVMFTSFGNAYNATRNAAYVEPLLKAAASLASRFNEVVGCTRSWDNKRGVGSDSSDQFLVIIDNLMNLELLFWASKFGENASGNATTDMYRAFGEMAVRHARRTMAEHVREDGSTWQVVGYNVTDGNVMSKFTVQGLSNSSTWARGQAWAIYGFTMAYRYTGLTELLHTACKTADYFIRNVPPADKVPFWDFDAVKGVNGGYQPRDTSAASIAASGMLELAGFMGKDGNMYRRFALGVMERLATMYCGDADKGYRIPAILVNGTAHYSTHHFDTALVFGDYYFVEALYRLQNN